jgi:hypothetical protein
MERRDFLARFSGLTIGGLFVPETSGFIRDYPESISPLTRAGNQDLFEATFYCYGKMAWSGPKIYEARKSEGHFNAIVDREIEAFRRDMRNWLLKPLDKSTWPDPGTLT